MPHHDSDQRHRARDHAFGDALARVGRQWRRLRRRGEQTATNPFAATLSALFADDPVEAAALRAADGASGAPADPVAELRRHAIALGPLVKRRTFPGLEGVPAGLTLGWAQLPQTRGRGFSIGMFTDRRHFSQIAFADAKGRVFAGTDPTMDTHDLKPRFLFGKEGTARLPDGPRFGHAAPRAGETARMLDVVTGGVVGRDANGRMTWLASWLKTGGRYTLEQMRADLPAAMRIGLEYRDALAIAFLATYLLPSMNGLLLGFGAGNIFRRLNREAPMGAIRRAVHDTMEARAHGLRASGLEDLFADLMREAGALGEVRGLEPVHGAEPLRLYTSSYSGNYFFVWSSQMAVEPALASLKIEGNLNRFAAVSAWLERNARIGVGPTEDTVTRAQAAQIDMALLANPALLALPGEEKPGVGFDPVHDDGTAAAWRLVEEARAAARMAAASPDPTDPGAGFADPDDLPRDAEGSEWVYRQTLATLIRRLRLPYRFDADFRVDLEGGQAALGFTTAGAALMPDSRYDEATHGWKQLDDDARAAMSAVYNLRVGLMMAALAFGADARVRRVSLHIDSIGLEEAVAEQDSAIAAMTNDALARFERMPAGDLGAGSGKGDPKDGDVHGDPTHTLRAMTGEMPGPGREPGGPASGEGTDAGEGAAPSEPADVQDSLDRQFEELMRGGDIDETVFSLGPDARRTNGGTADEPSPAPDGEEPRPQDGSGQDGNPLDAVRRNPTVRTLVTVTFDRDAFLAMLWQEGLAHPIDAYLRFHATLEMDGHGNLLPTEAAFDLRDARFSPAGAQEEPELIDKDLTPGARRVLGTADATGLAIQRADLLQRAVADLHRLAADGSKPSVAKAQEAMRIVRRLGDPELTELAPQATSALIDGRDTPDFEFTLADELDRERVKARDQLFSGQVDRAIDTAEAAIARLDALFAQGPGVPRYFNSYAERVVYNRLFATGDETTVLIPDNLFYAHMEMADVLAQLKGAKAALPHLNAMVKYAPAYPLSHMRLAVQLAREEDWDLARAACLNALRVALDRDDAAFAYYRLAYAEWMQDRFDTAAAAYIMAERIAPGQIAALEGELGELVSRAESQCVRVPESVDEAVATLAAHDLPVWPHTEVAGIVHDAARVCVDEGMFVPARTLTVAAARMDDGEADGIDVTQAQFLRSLNA
ncbi:tetratricopeptide repeat protein [Bifidobacterium pullorum subsp. saeculare]|uniref:Tetratricopeptide repeat protein n=1 Tax=Bifidobacterium pullorum subsp. saeculare TaxID=78257 RepID=A0A938WUT1_9BIFI|nr:tetratricopeptide repeat protein [Bifidobacterium pullorum]MBM6699145.1 tetratricopeptide repeat protein [Bifidobacterium pullorum subsp. saeculare]